LDELEEGRGREGFGSLRQSRGGEEPTGDEGIEYCLGELEDEVRVVAVGLERERCFAGERRERVSEEAELVVSMKEKEGGRDEGE
jgi:hypothetical protein